MEVRDIDDWDNDSDDGYAMSPNAKARRDQQRKHQKIDHWNVSRTPNLFGFKG